MTAQETTAYKAIEANLGAEQRKLETLKAELAQLGSSSLTGTPRSIAWFEDNTAGWLEYVAKASVKDKIRKAKEAAAKIERNNKEIERIKERMALLENALIPQQIALLAKIEQSMLTYVETYNNIKSAGGTDAEANLAASAGANTKSPGVTTPQWVKNPMTWIIAALAIAAIATTIIIIKRK